MARISVDFDDKLLKQNLRNFDGKVNRRVAALFDFEAFYAAGWMKQNAPWNDDTGAARSGLFAIANSDREFHEIIMSYSVNYGIWLEVANSGRYSIITPAMRIIGEKVMRDLQNLLDHMDGAK